QASPTAGTLWEDNRDDKRTSRRERTTGVARWWQQTRRPCESARRRRPKSARRGPVPPAPAGVRLPPKHHPGKRQRPTGGAHRLTADPDRIPIGEAIARYPAPNAVHNNALLEPPTARPAHAPLQWWYDSLKASLAQVALRLILLYHTDTVPRSREF